MKKEKKMGADHDGKALSEVPVPGVRAVEISHTVEDVKLEEVELHQSQLGKRDQLLHLTEQTGAAGYVGNVFTFP